MNGLTLREEQLDRAAGVLLMQACGDALGVPYEFWSPEMIDATPEMKGGGLGPYKPGEWSDDTEMALCIADVAAGGVDLTTDAALDEVALRFIGWCNGWARDVGVQTSHVLSEASHLDEQDGTESQAAEPQPAEAAPGAGARCQAAAARYAETGAAGNGALMRTGIVGVSRLFDREATAAAARAVAELTHAHPLCSDSCVLWSEAVRVAVLEARLDVLGGLDLLREERRDDWRLRIEDATGADPVRFGEKSEETGYSNGYTVGALQCAWAAISSAPAPEDAQIGDAAGVAAATRHVQEVLESVVRAGHDTDTAAAIAGALLGARWGAACVPAPWRELVHGRAPSADGLGFEVRRADDLVQVASAVALAGCGGQC